MPGGGSGIDSPGLGAARGVGRGGVWTRHQHKKAKGVAGGGFGGGGGWKRASRRGCGAICGSQHGL